MCRSYSGQSISRWQGYWIRFDLYWKNKPGSLVSLTNGHLTILVIILSHRILNKFGIPVGQWSPLSLSLSLSLSISLSFYLSPSLSHTHPLSHTHSFFLFPFLSLTFWFSLSNSLKMILLMSVFSIATMSLSHSLTNFFFALFLKVYLFFCSFFRCCCYCCKCLPTYNPEADTSEKERSVRFPK